MPSSRAFRSLCSLLFCYAAAYCTPSSKKTAEVVKSSPVKNTSGALDEKELDSYRAEVALGRDMAGRMIQYYGSYGDEELITYINKVGQYVARYSDHPELRYMFGILDTDLINAFACPGGYILITLGTLRNVRSEAELAAILGHEIAHVGEKHMFKTILSMGKNIQKEAEEVEKKGQAKESISSVVRKRPAADSSEAAELISRYITQNAGIGVSLLQAAKAGMGVLLEKGLDKKLEFEADHLGVGYAIKAGYDPNAMTTFLARLDKQKKKNDLKILEKTHPKIEDREAEIAKVLLAMNSKEIIGSDGESRYKVFLDKLPAPKIKDGVSK